LGQRLRERENLQTHLVVCEEDSQGGYHQEQEPEEKELHQIFTKPI
jgi:hypothetical protein